MATILLVDDDEAFRSVLRRGLQSAGYQVIEAEDGGVALRALRGATVDLVITDILMPGTEGIETIIAVQRLHPDLKIIAISGGGTLRPQEYLNMAKDFGVVHTLAKPFTNAEIIAAIEDALKV